MRWTSSRSDTTVSEARDALPSTPVTRAALALCLAGAAYYIGVALMITLSRIGYPYALEWLEGTSLIHVERILSGRLLYTEPSLSYVTLSYPPLYYYVSAALSAAFGGGFTPLRVVSLGASVGCVGLIYATVRHQRATVSASLISAGLFCATFRIGGAWFDIARVDMLAAFLMLASLRLMLSRTSLGMGLAGIAITLACLTKQPYLIVLVAMCAHLLIVHRDRNAAVFVMTSVGSLAAATWLLNQVHGGWYGFFVFEMPGRHDLIREFEYGSRLLWIDTMVLAVPVVAAIAMWFLLGVLRASTRPTERGSWPRDAAAILVVTGATLAISWSGLMNPGGYNNVLVPLLAMLAVIAGLGLDRILKTWTGAAASAGIALLAVQFAILYFPPGAQVPTEQDRLAGDEIVNLLRAQDGDVFVPYHPELPLFAGKPAYANYIALYELEGGQGGGDEKLWSQVRSALAAAVARRKFELILLDKPQFWGAPDRYYGSSEVGFEQGVFYPVTGWRTRPDVAYSVTP